MLAYSKFQIPVSNSDGHVVLSDGVDGHLHYNPHSFHKMVWVWFRFFDETRFQ